MIYYYKINKYKTYYILIIAKTRNIKLKLFRLKFDIPNADNKFQILKISKIRQEYRLRKIYSPWK